MTKRLFIILLVILTYKSFSNTKFYRCSYRDDPSSSIVIGWSNDGKSTNAKIYYGTQDFGTNWKSYPLNHGIDRTENLFGLNHQYSRLTGLTSNTIYYFVICDDQGMSSRMSFKTLSDNSNIPITFVSGGDSRTGFFTEFESSKCRPRRQDGNKLVAKIRPDFVAFTGDYIFDLDVFSGVKSLWEDWLEDWQLTIGPSGRLTPIVPTFGNHELSEYVYKLFDIPNTNCYYSLGFGGNLLRIYSINSSLACDTTMLNWFTNDLKLYTNNSNEPFWKIAQYHFALLPHAQYLPDKNIVNCWANLFMQYKIKLGMEGHVHVQKITYPIIASSAEGNDNGFDRDDSSGTVYIGEGCWGAPLRELFTNFSSTQAYKWTKVQDKFAGFNIITVRKSQIEIRTAKFDNVQLVSQIQENDSAGSIPAGLNLWLTPDGYVVYITNYNLNYIKKYYDDKSQIYTNPKTLKAKIKLIKLKEDALVEIYSSFGQKIITQNITKGTKTVQLDFSNYSKGNYYVFVKGKEILESLKVIYSN